MATRSSAGRGRSSTPRFGEPSVNCPRAGPGGDGTCGTNCESYCYLFNAACSQLYKPLPNCLEACNVLKDTKMFDVVVNHDGDSSAVSVGPREQLGLEADGALSAREGRPGYGSLHQQ